MEDDEKKEVKLRVTEGELESLSRTRRRRRVRRADLTRDSEKTNELAAVSVVKKPEGAPDRAPDRALVPEAPKELVKEPMKEPVKVTTASLPANPNMKTPKIIYTKKRHVHVAPKTAIVIPTKTSFTPKELKKAMPVAPVLAPALVKKPVLPPVKTRRFKAKRLSFTINSKRLTADRLTAARVAKMPLSEVKQKLVAASLLKGNKSNSPEPVLRGMLVNWMLLHSGA